MSEWDVTRPAGSGPTPPDPEELPPTQALPPTGGVVPPDSPGIDAGAAGAGFGAGSGVGVGGPGGGGGPGGPGGPYGSYGVPGPSSPEPWYRRSGPLAAAIGVSLALLFLLIAVIVWITSDDDDEIIVSPTLPVATTTTSSTTTTSTTVPATTTSAPTTSTSTSTSTTTSSTTSTTSTTTTTVPETTTTVEATTTTSSIPVVTVPPADDATLLDVIAASPDLSRLRDLIALAELGAVYDDPDAPVTLLAPSNDAIDLVAASPGGGALLADPVRVGELLLRHTVEGEPISVTELFRLDELTMADGSVLEVDAERQEIEGAEILVPDITAASGVLHVIDRVILP